MNTDRAGLLYALAGFCTLSIGDAIIKGMAGEWPAPAMAATRYIAGTVLLATLMVRHGGLSSLRLPRDPLQWVRGVAISLSAVGMFLAVWLMPLAEATTIAFTQPMITALLAAVLLGERARPSTWIATVIAFAGVFLVAATTAAHFTGIESFRMHWPDWSVAARCAFIGLTATLAQWLIFMGTVKAGAGTVAPMTYGQLLMAVALGALFFGDWPDATALLGAAVIIGAGLFLWWHGRAPEPAKTDL